MKILGIDPGTLCTGFGIIKFERSEFTLVKHGAIQLPKEKELHLRLEIIYDEIAKLIKIYRPDEFAIETAFYGKNVQSAMKIGYARGVSILAAVHNKLPVNEYSPREVKKAVVGKGAASKEQVQFMINNLLDISPDKMKFDESDALAVAVCHALRSRIPNSKNKSWKSFIEENPERIIQ